MIRGQLFQESYRPQFSGHETFPLRHGWLEKAYREVSSYSVTDNKGLFVDDEAIARFGVGKNMVVSMRHWALSLGVIEESPDNKGWRVTNFGDFLFHERKGKDRYLEHPSSLWALHWTLASNTNKTTWYWAFNHFPGPDFERKTLVQKLLELAHRQAWPRVAETTIRRDVECFVRMYVSRRSEGSFDEDCLESPLIELSLIRQVHARDGFHLVRGEKSSLGDGIFLYALIDFWRKAKVGVRTLSFEAIAHEPGSPGRVFLLDENSLAERLSRLGEMSQGKIEWSETAGLRQVIFREQPTDEEQLDFLALDYISNSERRTA